ncbi:LPS export ABC transporter periplasmic protein LptC [Vibrio sp. JC009]|uniref:LPS export ABC transporter periplasmic protein LptC n=1 Tax=Vibrio sp. JC009 TaxID=2912314 RepID=UPI0023B1F51E|nr:LPS export ABC transporter periplasmic protein LptC [Vibrio sp. JC009]WED21520.1 LPS export ABC transporter periplasmic protein LptC [Vibrio sp. JC009]
MTVSRAIYAFLLIVVAYSSYYLYLGTVVEPVQINPDLELPALSGENVDNTSYTEAGIRSYRVTAKHLDHFAKSGDTVFEYPVLFVYKEGETQEWEINAERGVLDKDHVLRLYGNVLAKNLLPDAGFDTMATDELLIHLDNRDFWADTAVLLVGPQFETKGKAMKGNFGENVATLYNKVQGRYETLTP